MKALLETQVIEILPEGGKLGVYDINGKECPIPSFEEVSKETYENTCRLFNL